MRHKKRGRPRIYCKECGEPKTLVARGMCGSCYRLVLQGEHRDRVMKEYLALVGTMEISEQLLTDRYTKLRKIKEKTQQITSLIEKQLREIEEVVGDEAILDPSLSHDDGSSD